MSRRRIPRLMVPMFGRQGPEVRDISRDMRDHAIRLVSTSQADTCMDLLDADPVGGVVLCVPALESDIPPIKDLLAQRPHAHAILCHTLQRHGP